MATAKKTTTPKAAPKPAPALITTEPVEAAVKAGQETV